MSDSIWSNVLGQDVPVELLKRSASRGRLAHGYVFFGAAGTGRRLVATKLAQALFCTEVPDDELDACGCCPSCKQVAANNHPDLLYVAKPDGKRELPIDLIAGRPERRGREGLCYELAMRPMSADRRIAIIDDADAMNAESANALLKTLEEPPPGSLLVLLAGSPESILPTIRSRVQPLYFSPLSAAHVVELILSEDPDISPEDAAAIANLAGGSLETAKQLLDPELRRLRDIAVDALCQPRFHAVELAAALNKAIDDLGGDASAKRQQADWVFRFMVDLLRLALVTDNVSNATEAVGRFLRHFPADAAVRCERIGLMIERMVAAERAVAEMTAVPLAIEGLCDDLSAILRGENRPVLLSRDG